MARIRSIKPEFWTSEQVAECSPTARLLFVGLWTFCDDAGRHVASVKRLKMEVFPGDAFSDDEMSSMVDELISAGLVFEYETEGKSYWQVTGWHHQKIDKPNVRHPDPHSGTSRRVVAEQSPNGSRTVDDSSPPEGSRGDRSRGESNGEESNGEESVGAGTLPQAASAPPAIDLSEFVFPTKSGEWVLPQSKLDEYVEAYPAMDVYQELRQLRQWCRDNPGERKTENGMKSFLTRNLNKAQNSGRFCRTEKPPDAPDPYAMFGITKADYDEAMGDG